MHATQPPPLPVVSRPFLAKATLRLALDTLFFLVITVVATSAAGAWLWLLHADEPLYALIWLPLAILVTGWLGLRLARGYHWLLNAFGASEEQVRGHIRAAAVAAFGCAPSLIQCTTLSGRYLVYFGSQGFYTNEQADGFVPAARASS